MPSSSPAPTFHFYGHSVVRAAFVLALFGWGVGFYGPPVFLHAVLARTGWSLALVSWAVTVHFLFGAGVVACLPALHRRFGVPAASVAGAMLLAAGVLGWATAERPWQLFVAAMCSGAGWAPLGAAGINAIVSPWFIEGRALALAKAYNGASVGGMVFSPVWALLIARVGFPAAAMIVGLAMVIAVLSIANHELARAPFACDQAADGLARNRRRAPLPASDRFVPAASGLWRDRRILSLAAAMCLGLFAQIGLIAQLFSLMAPTMGPQLAGGIMALATASGMAGRLLTARLLERHPDRRRAAAASYTLQAIGTLLLWIAGPAQPATFIAGVVLFGCGIGNATSLPPLIAQSDFPPGDVPRVVARSVALAQALYAFAPAVLAALIVGDAGATLAPGFAGHAYFFVIVALQALAALCVCQRRRVPGATG